MLRIIFRTVLVLTLAFLAIVRTSAAHFSRAQIQGFSYWMLFSGMLALLFLVYSVMKAVREPWGRRLYIRDVMVAVVWVIFWILSIGR